MRKRTYLPIAALAAGGVAVTAAMPASAYTTDVKRYARGVGNQYNFAPLLSAGDRLRHTTNSNLRYQMVGIPDGLGITKLADGTAKIYMNHELGNTVLSEPEIGGPLQRGSFVSALTLNGRGEVVSGERAFDTVYDENRYVGRAATEHNNTPGFGRFCSATLVGAAEGMDRNIFLTNEESAGASPDYEAGFTFDKRGGSTVAVFDNQAHALPRLGHFPKENSAVAPNTGDRTVVISLEDGPESPDSQLYMYVGHKNRTASSVLRRNGLDNGKLYVFASTTAGKTSEVNFRNGSIDGHWVEIPDAESLSDIQLEKVSDRKGAFGFVRLEDGTFNPARPGEFFFNSTGGAEGNLLGRGYRLTLNDGNPTGSARLSIIFNTEQLVARGMDAPVSPDNIGINGSFLTIQEDPTTFGREALAKLGRDSSVWRYNLNNLAVSPERFPGARVGVVNDPGRDGVPVPPGSWETSGIVAAESVFGQGSWILDVQAHAPTTPPGRNTVEDGQLLVMRPQAGG